MKHFISLLLFFPAFLISAFSQNIIEVDYVSNDIGACKFYCNSRALCNYIVELNFMEFTNYKSNIPLPFRKEVHPGRTLLFEIQPANPSGLTSFKYIFSYQKGCLNPEINTGFIYLLPVGNGKQTEVFKLTYTKLNNQVAEFKDWYVVGFKMNQLDTIYAARRGVVCDLNTTSLLTLPDIHNSNDENFIEIMHDDCSFGKYQVFSSVLVKIGQKVEAGDPIALAGGEKYAIGSHVRFSVTYNFEVYTSQKNKRGISATNVAYVPLVFYTKDQQDASLVNGKTYISEHPDNLIMQEMSKRESAKWMKNKESQATELPFQKL